MQLLPELSILLSMSPCMALRNGFTELSKMARRMLLVLFQVHQKTSLWMSARHHAVRGLWMGIWPFMLCMKNHPWSHKTRTCRCAMEELSGGHLSCEHAHALSQRMHASSVASMHAPLSCEHACPPQLRACMSRGPRRFCMVQSHPRHQLRGGAAW
jgi:hypothetical protein